MQARSRKEAGLHEQIKENTMAHAAVATPATEVRVNRFLAQVYLIMSLGLVVTALVATWVHGRAGELAGEDLGTRGTLAGDVRPLVRLNVSVIVEQNGRRERGGHGGGGRTGYDYFLSEDRAMGYAREALRRSGLRHTRTTSGPRSPIRPIF